MNNNLQFNLRLLLDEEVREIQYNQEQRTSCATLKIERLLSRSRILLFDFLLKVLTKEAWVKKLTLAYPNLKFRTRFHIPGVIGVIDGSQIGIFPPSTNHNQYPEFVYVNRKDLYEKIWKNSINTQLIVDHTYRILNVNAKFPGSTHDSHIWKMSLIRNHLKPWLLTPFSNPGDGSPESRFNVKFTLGRSVVERAIGMLKGRWRRLCKQRMLHYKPTIASKIINACAVLHNICIENFDAAYEDEEYDEPYNANDLIHFPAGNALHTESNNNRSEIMDYINRVQ
ncbi:uncharacterized protein LOC126554995 [Aphis gossypii]|uniref:uncharacterized protein LOC126554995 n=1 Tax=Aphis gossypii TaxID=80765 RepID=UPI0021596B6C|nr:uncharacterized protein LOC126554995 [Aphis gossypii]